MNFSFRLPLIKIHRLQNLQSTCDRQLKNFNCFRTCKKHHCIWQFLQNINIFFTSFSYFFILAVQKTEEWRTRFFSTPPRSISSDLFHFVYSLAFIQLQYYGLMRVWLIWRKILFRRKAVFNKINFFLTLKLVSK